MEISGIALVKSVVFTVGKYVNFIDEGSMSRETYTENVLKELPQELHAKVVDVINYHILELPMIEGMAQLLEKLHKDGYKLYITSNLDEYHAKQMYETYIKDYFDGMIFSSEIKVRKPHRNFFAEALKRFNVEPSETLFIDDLEGNVLGAEKCGVKGFVFDGNPKSAEKFIYENS